MNRTLLKIISVNKEFDANNFITYDMGNVRY